MPSADPLLDIFLSSQHIPINPRPHDPSSSRCIAVRRALGSVSYTCQHVLIPHSPLLPLICAMNPTSIYAIAAGGVVVVLIIIKSLVSVEQVLCALALLVAKHFTYPYFVRRHHLLGPWSRADVFLQMIYFTINMFCMTFGVTSVKEAGARAGTLAMVNMSPSFFGFHLSFLADLLGIPLSNYRRIHRMTGWMSFVLCLVHALSVIHGDPSYLHDMRRNLHPVIVSYWKVTSFKHGNVISLGRSCSWSPDAALTADFP